MLATLLLTLEDDPHCLKAVDFSGSPKGVLDVAPFITHCLCVTPMNEKVLRRSDWRPWERVLPTCRHLLLSADELDRSDAWVVAAMWPQVKTRAVFLSSASLLFAQGQEQRLRQALLFAPEGNTISTVLSLPQNLLSHTTIAPTMLVLDAHANSQSIRMLDVGGQLLEGQLKNRFGKDVDLERIQALNESHEDIPQLAFEAFLPEVEANEFSLMPPRYTRRVADLGGVRVKLGEIIAATIRSPVPSKDFNAWQVWEVGIPVLDRWQGIQGGYERSMLISSRKADESLLRKGDVVISIKGTVGKVGIIGHIPGTISEVVADALISSVPTKQPRTLAAVPAASCIGLRVDRQQVLPEYLTLYMRSEDFKRQLEALRVGATIVHITPATLLSSVMVPLPSLDQQAVLWERYMDLCKLEKDAENIRSRMEAIRATLFRPISTDG